MGISSRRDFNAAMSLDNLHGMHIDRFDPVELPGDVQRCPVGFLDHHTSLSW